MRFSFSLYKKLEFLHRLAYTDCNKKIFKCIAAAVRGLQPLVVLLQKLAPKRPASIETILKQKLLKDLIYRWSSEEMVSQKKKKKK